MVTVADSYSGLNPWSSLWIFCKFYFVEFIWLAEKYEKMKKPRVGMDGSL